MSAPIPLVVSAQTTAQFLALLQRGCAVKAAWMACALPWQQWPAFRHAYATSEPSPWAKLAGDARRARGLALAVAWTELRQSDAARWLAATTEARSKAAHVGAGAWQESPLLAAVQELLPLLEDQPELREKLSDFIERHANHEQPVQFEPPIVSTANANAREGNS
jgi:hypothetical protein